MSNDLEFVSRAVVDETVAWHTSGLVKSVAAPVERDQDGPSRPPTSTTSGTLFDQLQSNRDSTAAPVRTNSLLPKRLDDEDVAFLDEQELARRRREDILSAQQEHDRSVFELAVAAKRTAPAAAPPSTRTAFRAPLIRPGLGAASSSASTGGSGVAAAAAAAAAAVGDSAASNRGAAADSPGATADAGGSTKRPLEALEEGTGAAPASRKEVVGGAGGSGAACSGAAVSSTASDTKKARPSKDDPSVRVPPPRFLGAQEEATSNGSVGGTAAAAPAAAGPANEAAAAASSLLVDYDSGSE